LTTPWEKHSWPLEKGQIITHEAIRDVSKRGFLLSIGKNASEERAKREPSIPFEDPQKFAFKWEDVMLPYPTEDIEYDTDATPPDVSQCEKNTEQAGIIPGSLTVWFERSFSHDLLGVVQTGDDFEFKFAATSVTLYALYHQNGCTILVKDGTATASEQETFFREQDDFRPGTPFIVQNCDEASNDGFYRVREVRNDGSNVFVIVDNNSYEQQTLVATAVAQGTATCDFGGDWYTLRSGNGNSTNSGIGNGGKLNNFFSNYGDSTYERGPDQTGPVVDFWFSQKDLFHRYEPIAYAVPPDENPSGVYESYQPNWGPNDSRCPDGGQLSKDFNGEWVRTDNPNLYSTYDDNCHRFHIEADSEGSYISLPSSTYEQFSYLVETSEFLNEQTDPKEIHSPFKYKDTNASRWKYKGKVRFKKSQITDHENLGTFGYPIRTGYVTESNTKVGASTDHQYVSTHSFDAGGSNTGSRTQDGYLPPSDTSVPLEKWIDQSYNDAVQNMVSRVCGSEKWLHEPTDQYITNWFDIHSQNLVAPVEYGAFFHLNGVEEWFWYGTFTGTETYEDLFAAEGLNAWKPEMNQYMNPFPPMDDELFGENGSALELILSQIPDSYDWWFDSHTFVSKRVCDDGIIWLLSRGVTWDDDNLPGVFNGVSCITAGDVLEACWPMTSAAGTWRRTFKNSLGRVSNSKMRDGNRSDPISDEYINYSIHPDTSVPQIMYGRFKMEEPEPDEYYTWSQAITINNPSATDSSFTLSGNETAKFKEGWRVFDFIDSDPSIGDEYFSYLILKVVYDSDEDETNVWMDELFHTNEPETVYGDINLSTTHDSHETVGEQEIYNKNIYKILNDCRDVLLRLGLRRADIPVGLYEGDTMPDYFSHSEPTHAELITYINENAANWYRGEENTGSTVTWTEEFSIAIGGLTAGDTSIEQTVSHWAKASILLTLPFDLRGTSTKIYTYMKAYPVIADKGPGITLPMWSVKGVLNLDLDSPPASWLAEKPFTEFISYGVVELADNANLDFSTYNPDDGTYDFRYLVDQEYEFFPSEFLGGVNFQESQAVCSLYNSNNIAILPDLDEVGEVFGRGYERADYGLEDSSADTTPPAGEPEWEIEPYIYARNYDPSGQSLTFFKDVEPEWGIKAKAQIQSDLQGNGVFYIFDYNQQDPSSETPVYPDKMDLEQIEQGYDEILDMGVGASPGDNDDAWLAFDNFITTWQATLNSRDNASQFIGNPDDNYNTPTDPIPLAFGSPIEDPSFDLGVVPFFPSVGRWKTVEGLGTSPLEETFDFVDYYWVATDLPYTDYPQLEFKIEYFYIGAPLPIPGWNTLFDYGDAVPTPPAGAPAESKTAGNYWIPTADIPMVAAPAFRITFRNANQTEGMSIEDTP